MRARRKRTEAAGPREHAFDILRRVENAGAYASILLEQSEDRLGDSRDAALLHELVLGVLRRRLTLDAVLERVARRPVERIDLEVRIAARLGAYALLYLDRVPGFAAVDTAVALVRRGGGGRAAGFVNAVLRTVAREGRDLLPPAPEPGDVAGLSLRHSHPRWWTERTVRRTGWDAACRLLAADNEPARTVLCANPRRTGVDGLESLLADEGVVVERCRYAPQALRVLSGNPARGRALRDGLAWVQDEASQLVPLIFGGPTGGRTIDLCAAPGGKTFLLASREPDDAIHVGVDRHQGRLRRLASMGRRIGVTSVRAVTADMARPEVPFAVRFDRVLLDAPCSGTGTLRRHPEIRWRLSEEDFKLLAARQKRLLETAARLAAPGGRIVYSVCSMEPEEGEEIVLDFLDRHRTFRAEDPRSGLPASCDALIGEDGFLRTSPAVGAMDGFFAALLVRG